MDKEHIVVLYREFLFRMVDRDLLSVHAQGDTNKFLGRLAAFLIWISIGFAALAMGVRRGSALGPEHTLIATTMLVVSIFSVLAWDSLFPDRRDVLILTPLGVSAITIFAAKGAALLAALGVAVAVFNALPGIAFPLAMTPPEYNLLEMVFSTDLYRAFVGYWLTMFLAGGFILFAVVCSQAVASQLPRTLALGASSLLQIAVFCTAVGVYFLQPSLGSKEQLTLAANQRALAWLPSYWFLGLLQQLTGTATGAAAPVLIGLAQRAWMAVALAGGGAAAVVLASCAAGLRKIAEQPDVVPGRRKRLFTVSLGASPRAAIVQWTARTLLRSRQHRVLVTFYSGIGFATIVLFLETPVVHIMSHASIADPWRDLSMPLIGASFVTTICWIVGVRAAFVIPIEARANWIFRLALTDGPAEPLAAARLSLLAAGAGPVWLAAAVVFLLLWPTPQALQHLVVLALFGAALAALCLRGFRKIPFTCTYLPGTSQLHITLALSAMLGLNSLFLAATYERRSLYDFKLYVEIVAALAAVTGIGWYSLRAGDGRSREALTFDQAPEPVVMRLGLERDREAV
jgi:hypothetical protein